MSQLNPNQTEINGVIYNISQIFYNGTIPYEVSDVSLGFLFLYITLRALKPFEHLLLLTKLHQVHTQNMFHSSRNLHILTERAGECLLRRRL
jgi:hypothetical protein